MPPRFPDHIFSRLHALASAEDPEGASLAMPPDVFDAWAAGGAAFGKFVLLEELGRGGQSVVRRAWQIDLRREVALKIVTGVNPELRRRFMEEARLGARLAHPAIVPVFEAGEERETLWLCMPRIEGETLDRSGLSPVEAARAVAAAARGIHEAHRQGVIHRDLKPRNLMRSASGVHVLDFGLAKAFGGETQTSASGAALGTPHFMAPEQASGGSLDPRTDVYALGATLYALVGGRPPYPTSGMAEFVAAILKDDPPPIRTIAPATAAPLAAVIGMAMDRDPARRYPTAAALADDLERFAAGDPVAARPPSAARRAARWARLNPAATAALATLLVASAAIATVSALGRPGRSAPSATPALFEQALRHSRAREWREAEAIFTRILAREPDHVDALTERARCGMALDKYEEASQDLDRANAIAPNVPQRWILRGECSMWVHQFRKAEENFSRVLDLDPDNVEGWVGRAGARLKRDEPALALEDAERASTLNPLHAWAHGARARALSRLDRKDEAMAAYGEALKLFPREGMWLSERGLLKLERKDFAGALQDLEAGAALSEFARDHSQDAIRAAQQGLGMAE